MSAQISVTGIGIGSVLLDDSFTGVGVLVVNNDDTGVLGWKWEVLDAPFYSVSYNPLPVPSFDQSLKLIPDVFGGTWRIRLTTYKDAGRTFLDGADVQEVGIRFPAPFDWCVPAAGERTEIDAGRGWALMMSRIIDDIWQFMNA